MNNNGTVVSLFVLKDYCKKCKHCQKLNRHNYVSINFEVWQCAKSARGNLIARLENNRVQYVYTDNSAAFTFLSHACPHFVMISMESEMPIPPEYLFG